MFEKINNYKVDNIRKYFHGHLRRVMWLSAKDSFHCLKKFTIYTSMKSLDIAML